jgi:hypothetical protein
LKDVAQTIITKLNLEINLEGILQERASDAYKQLLAKAIDNYLMNLKQPTESL